MLTGIAKCGKCGRTMAYFRSKRDGTVYLRCKTHALKARYKERCHPNMVQEKHVIAAIAKFMRESVTWDSVQAQFNGTNMTEERARIQAEIVSTQTAVERIGSERRRMLVGYNRGQISLDLYRTQDDSYLEQLDNHKARLDELEAVLDALPDMAQMAERTFALAHSFEWLVGRREPAEVNKALHDAPISVVIEQNQVRVGWSLHD